MAPEKSTLGTKSVGPQLWKGYKPRDASRTKQSHKGMIAPVDVPLIVVDIFIKWVDAYYVVDFLASHNNVLSCFGQLLDTNHQLQSY